MCDEDSPPSQRRRHRIELGLITTAPQRPYGGRLSGRVASGVVPVSPYIAHLRQSIGHDLLLLPSVAVLPRDDLGRILLVRQSDTGRWATIGGSVEVDEDPGDAARREATEEAVVTVQLGEVVGVLGGPEFRLDYPNGDQVAYVSVVYEASVVGGEPAPDRDEVSEVAWVGLAELDTLDVTPFTRAMFTRLGLLD
jgi:ADP-ribose pyrophosphatase YjhB (NUDIX family)